MKIESISLKGFRCFGGDEVTTVKISEGLTTLIGANGSGKTALLEALTRVFGVTRDQRTIKSSDFYIPPGEPIEQIETRELFIDVSLIFPELQEDSYSNSAVPHFFRNMVVDQLGAVPFIRIRLEAQWFINDGTIDGNIEQSLWWVTTRDEYPEENYKEKCESRDRALIQVHYIPAVRDPSSQLKYTASSMAGRLLNAMKWSDSTKSGILEASNTIRGIFSEEQGIQSVNKTLTQKWSLLHDDIVDTEPEFNLVSKKFEEIIRSVSVVFRPTELGGERDLDALSEGQKSLFYFSLTSTVFEIERCIDEQRIFQNHEESFVNDGENFDNTREVGRAATDEITSAISTDTYTTLFPALTIFAFEEPENHLSPYFLARIITQIRDITSNYAAQAVITSHSSGILGRIEPSEIRHFRLQRSSRISVINDILLPDQPDEVAKFVRGAVQAYPELYFARFVILGEGDSEEIILPRLASAMGFEVDKSFVAIVPLGGRHVNYFWKLLNRLQIPCATLLDLDYGREGAGWGRIQYICTQLLQIGVPSSRILNFTNENGIHHEILETDLANLQSISKDRLGSIYSWIKHLEQFGVFFSEPLDLDLMMLERFPTAYKATIGTRGGPRFPTEEGSYAKYQAEAAEKVIGTNYELFNYGESTLDLLPWYRYLFLNHSKPSTHLQALTNIENEDFISNAPSVLMRLIKFCQSKVLFKLN